MTNTASYLVRQALRHAKDDDVPEMFVRNNAEAMRYAIGVALKRWRNRGYGGSKALTPKDEDVILPRVWDKLKQINVFPSYMDAEDLIMAMMDTLVRSDEGFRKKPLEEQEDFLLYLGESMRNDIRLIQREQYRHGQPNAIPLENMKTPESENINGDSNDDADSHELEAKVAVTDPLKKMTEDVAIGVDASLYTRQFIDTLKENEQDVLLILMDNPKMADREIGEQFDPVIPQSTVWRIRRRVKKKFEAFDKDRLPGIVKKAIASNPEVRRHHKLKKGTSC